MTWGAWLVATVELKGHPNLFSTDGVVIRAGHSTLTAPFTEKMAQSHVNPQSSTGSNQPAPTICPTTDCVANNPHQTHYDSSDEISRSFENARACPILPTLPAVHQQFRNRALHPASLLAIDSSALRYRMCTVLLLLT